METVNIFRAENLEGRVDVARAVGSTATLMFIYDVAPGESQSDVSSVADHGTAVPRLKTRSFSPSSGHTPIMSVSG